MNHPLINGPISTTLSLKTDFSQLYYITKGISENLPSHLCLLNDDFLFYCILFVLAILKKIRTEKLLYFSDSFLLTHQECSLSLVIFLSLSLLKLGAGVIRNVYVCGWVYAHTTTQTHRVGVHVEKVVQRFICRRIFKIRTYTWICIYFFIQVRSEKFLFSIIFCSFQR